jgi:hypothetical protein
MLPKGSTLNEAVREYTRAIGSAKPKTITEAVGKFFVLRHGKEVKPRE